MIGKVRFNAIKFDQNSKDRALQIIDKFYSSMEEVVQQWTTQRVDEINKFEQEIEI